VTDIIRRDVRSYRDLPKNLYQVQTKFRDEIRPRFGLMRGREFIMKDGYSFHATREDAHREYRLMYETYERIFARCGLKFRAVEADTGAIGGSLSHEFQVLAESGEDAIVACDQCGYAANVEKAELGPMPMDAASEEASYELRRVSTPGQKSVEDVSAYLDVPADRFIKTLVFEADGAPVVAMVRGDQTLSEAKLKASLGAQVIALADPDVVTRVTGAPVGFAGPVGLTQGTRVVADWSIDGIRGATAGANRQDEHLVGLEHGRDFGADVTFADLRQAVGGEACPRCGKGRYTSHRGIEVGHVFYLGTKYSSALGANILDAEGRSVPIEMGCYGIGISRTMAAAIEQSHDENGIIWPMPLAPFAVEIVPISVKDAPVMEAAEKLYAELMGSGVDCLLDDRDERPGVKFKDADLIGIPLRVTIGQKGLSRGVVEWKDRRTGEAHEVPVAEAAARLRAEAAA
jgi:prolyl-tRNA synthetase